MYDFSGNPKAKAAQKCGPNYNNNYSS